jgi:hypothetical protein
VGDHVLPDDMSDGGFKLLDEESILYTKKGTPKLIPVKKSQLSTSVKVNHFYCRSNER